MRCLACKKEFDSSVDYYCDGDEMSALFEILSSEDTEKLKSICGNCTNDIIDDIKKFSHKIIDAYTERK
jgi:hypothetical protein